MSQKRNSIFNRLPCLWRKAKRIYAGAEVNNIFWLQAVFLCNLPDISTVGFVHKIHYRQWAIGPGLKIYYLLPLAYRLLPAFIQHYPCIHCHSPIRIYNKRVNFHLFDSIYLIHNTTDLDNNICNCVNITRLAAPVACKQRICFYLSYHVKTFFSCNRRKPERDILQKFYIYTADTEHHCRTELRISYASYNNFYPLTYHLFY